MKNKDITKTMFLLKKRAMELEKLEHEPKLEMKIHHYNQLHGYKVRTSNKFGNRLGLPQYKRGSSRTVSYDKGNGMAQIIGAKS